MRTKSKIDGGYLKLANRIIVKLHFFDPVVPEITYFKHDVGTSNVIIFIGNPDVDSLSVVSDVTLFVT